MWHMRDIKQFIMFSYLVAERPMKTSLLPSLDSMTFGVGDDGAVVWARMLVGFIIDSISTYMQYRL